MSWDIQYYFLLFIWKGWILRNHIFSHLSLKETYHKYWGSIIQRCAIKLDVCSSITSQMFLCLRLVLKTTFKRFKILYFIHVFFLLLIRINKHWSSNVWSSGFTIFEAKFKLNVNFRVTFKWYITSLCMIHCCTFVLQYIVGWYIITKPVTETWTTWTKRS